MEATFWGEAVMGREGVTAQGRDGDGAIGAKRPKKEGVRP